MNNFYRDNSSNHQDSPRIMSYKNFFATLKHPYFLILLTFLVNAFFNSRFQLHYDETYYWVWSRHLDWSYFDHPPMIAYMIHLATLFGSQEFFVRLPALFCATFTLIIMYKLAQRMFNQKVATITLYLGISWPLLQGIFLITTPDSPLILFWALTLYAFYLGVFEDKIYQIYLSGIYLGLALMSKYSAILLLPGLFLFLLFSKEHRKLLLNKHVYLALVLSFILTLPIFIWNYHHSWDSFKFQMSHGYDNGRHFRLDSFFDYWTGQLGVAGPLMSLAMLFYFAKNLKSIFLQPKLAFLWWPFLFVLLFFADSSFYAYGGANWPLPGFISAYILLAVYLAKYNNRWIYRASLILIVVVTFMIKLPTQLLPQNIATKVSAIKVFYGNDILANEVQSFLSPHTILLACDYGNASRLWYYLHNTQQVYVLPRFEFANTYAYWNQNLNLKNKSAIFVCDLKIRRDKIIKVIKNLYIKDNNLCLNSTSKNPVNKYLESVQSIFYAELNEGNKLSLGQKQLIYFVNDCPNDLDTLDTYFTHINLIKKLSAINTFGHSNYYIYTAHN